jgi:hypothetical protein
LNSSFQVFKFTTFQGEKGYTGEGRVRLRAKGITQGDLIPENVKLEKFNYSS